MQGVGPGAHTEVLHVPSEKVGVIIGKGGSKIREIQDMTGASLQVARESDPATPHLREVTIRGPKEAVERAKQLVFETIQAHDQRNGHFGMNMGPGAGGVSK